MRTKLTFTAAVAALLMTGAAQAQLFGDEIGTDLDYNTFNTGFAETGHYDAWDRDGEAGLNEGEFATGIFSDWDADNDLQISEEEYGLGAERWYGADHGTAFTDYDADGSGAIDREEFGGGWDSAFYGEHDTDADGLLSEDEYTTVVYDAADLDEDEVLTIEEEGFFEGWFDGNDVTAEIQEVGDVLGG